MTINEEIHKELHDKIWNCKCIPLCSNGFKYCKNCQQVVLEFMDNHGAGTLTRDSELEGMTQNYQKAVNECSSYFNKIRAQKKIIEELKLKLKGIKDED